MPCTSSGPSTSTFGTQIMMGVPVTTTYAMTFAPDKSVADLQSNSVREDFALQCSVSTAAVTFESEPLDGCPWWDLTSRWLQATTSTKAEVKIFLESSDAPRKTWALLGHDPGYARACAYNLPPTATVDDLRSKRMSFDLI